MAMIQEIGATIGRWAKGMRARAQLRRELAQLELHGDLDRVLTDVGLTQSQLRHLVAAHPDASELLKAMLAQLRLGRDDIASGTLREMGWTCVGCTDKPRCREWLSGGDDDTEYRAFCPNAAFLDYELLKHRGSTS
jgi:hypothetical protein